MQTTPEQYPVSQCVNAVQYVKRFSDWKEYRKGIEANGMNRPKPGKATPLGHLLFRSGYIYNKIADLVGGPHRSSCANEFIKTRDDQ